MGEQNLNRIQLGIRKAKKVARRTVRVLLPGHRPDFIIIGGQKCGTSSLHYYLSQHPSLLASWPRKETHYFNRRIHYGQSLRWYEAHFKSLPGRERLRFETTPAYLYQPDTERQLHHHYPDLKLIVVLRNPVARAYSAWNHYRDIFVGGRTEQVFGHEQRRNGNYLFSAFYEGREHFPSFRECIDIEMQLIERDEGFEPALLRRGLYLEQLQRYWQYFTRESILILGFKDLVSNTTEVLNRVSAFVGATDVGWGFLDCKPKNTRSYPFPMRQDDSDFLEDFFAKPNRALLDTIGPLNW